MDRVRLIEAQLMKLIDSHTHLVSFLRRGTAEMAIADAVAFARDAGLHLGVGRRVGIGVEREG